MELHAMTMGRMTKLRLIETTTCYDKARNGIFIFINEKGLFYTPQVGVKSWNFNYPSITTEQEFS